MASSAPSRAPNNPNLARTQVAKEEGSLQVSGMVRPYELVGSLAVCISSCLASPRLHSYD